MKKSPVIKAAEETVRQSQHMLKQLAASLPQRNISELPVLETIVLEPGEKLPKSTARRIRDKMFRERVLSDGPITPATRRAMRFVKWKTDQLARADARLGRVPSERTLENRARWIFETAMLIEIGRPARLEARRQRKLDEIRAGMP
jgi:hypothetical protein